MLVGVVDTIGKAWYNLKPQNQKVIENENTSKIKHANQTEINQTEKRKIKTHRAFLLVKCT